jgi:3-oxoacyl-[acyl-carrier-protein] synthase-3
VRRCRIESLGVSLPRRGLLRRRPLQTSSVTHAVAAGRRCLAASSHGRADVRVLINTGVYRDGHVCEPAMACAIQRRLGINVEFQGRRTLAFDLLNGGCGMLNGLHVLCSLLRAGDASVGMVVSSEVNTDRRPDPSYPYSASGAAVLLDLAPRAATGFGAFAFETRDQHEHLYTSFVSLKQPRGRLVLSRQAELEEVYLEAVDTAVEKVLEEEHLRRADVTRVVPAQLSTGFLARLPSAVGLPRAKVVDYSATLADTLTTSTFLAFHRSLEERPAVQKEVALLLTFGSGITVGAAVYRF